MSLDDPTEPAVLPDQIVQWQPTHRVETKAGVAHGAGATGAAVLGALAVGALAVGVVAIGALAIGRLAVRHARFGRLEVDDLVVRRLSVLERR